MDDQNDEILPNHLRDSRRRHPIDFRQLFGRAPEPESEFRPLLQLTDDLRHVLVPVAPTRVFRDRLREGLMLSGRSRKKTRLASLVGPQPWNYWWVGAAALGSAVAAGGIIAWLLRTRQHHLPSGVGRRNQVKVWHRIGLPNYN